jgi:aspartyl-tRNA(Asn)/glutamyl-tRNA(Gln) amidotransferase subunit A
MTGTQPLSPTLDTIGPLAPSVACCALIDTIISGAETDNYSKADPRMLRLGVIRDYVWDQVSDPVGAAFERALGVLTDNGVHIRDVPDTQFLCELPRISGKGGFAAAESFHILHELILRSEAMFDPRVAQRVIAGGRQSAHDYLQLLDHRRRLIQAMDAVTWPFDAVVCPTVPCIAPLLSELGDDAMYFSMNSLMLRNPSIANFFDRPAITVPVHEPGTAPVGFMLIGHGGADNHLLRCAGGVESLLSPRN